MSTDNCPRQALQESLKQLAQSFQANETTISVEQIAECFDRLHHADKTALNRLFFLIYQNDYETIAKELHTAGSTRCTIFNAPFSTPIERRARQRLNKCHIMPPGTIAVQHTSVLRKATAGSPLTYQLPPRPRRDSANVNGIPDTASAGRISESLQPTPQSEQDTPPSPPPQTPRDHQAPVTPPLIPPTLGASGSEAIQGFAIATSGLAGRTENLPRPITAIINADDKETLKFSATIETLLQACISDSSAFLRAVIDGKLSLPNGQGWEAAIATKRNNADLRDLARIFHRFECYNIYQHVVDAGYHTGSHWIRDMRPLLAEKLSQDFPHCFPDQKAANKCLNWVDQGCRYRDWAERLSESDEDLGYLIALPCDVPHSAYTSRCTKEQISTTVVELKKLGIDNIVNNMKLSVLAKHITESLHEMTTRKRKASPESLHQRDTPLYSCTEAQFSMSRESRSTEHIDNVLPSAVRLHHGVTPPESTMFNVNQYTFDAFEDSWLEDWTTEESSGSTISTLMAMDTTPGFRHSNISRTDIRSPALSNRTFGSPAALTDSFNEWCQQLSHADRFPVDAT